MYFIINKFRKNKSDTIKDGFTKTRLCHDTLFFMGKMLNPI